MGKWQTLVQEVDDLTRSVLSMVATGAPVAREG
jgi:hypothetical protein